MLFSALSAHHAYQIPVRQHWSSLKPPALPELHLKNHCPFVHACKSPQYRRQINPHVSNRHPHDRLPPFARLISAYQIAAWSKSNLWSSLLPSSRSFFAFIRM